MLKLLPGLVVSASLAVAGTAYAQNTGSSAAGTPTTRAPMTMTMPAGPAGTEASSSVVTTSELAAIGAGAVVGAVIFQGAMWHGMTIVGAAIGGWLGDHIYSTHWANAKTGT